MSPFGSLVTLVSYLFSNVLRGPSVSSVAFYNPSLAGGSMLVNAGNGLGEPLNVVISGLSSPGVLSHKGILNYARAIGYSEECFGIHLGGLMSANLGDGNGWVNQTYELREDYENAGIGTCLESLIGGNHFRVFSQNGPRANSGAFFLAWVLLVVSLLQSPDVCSVVCHKRSPPSTTMISCPMVTILDGMHNNLVAAALGETSFNGIIYMTTAVNVTGLLPPGSQGVNHGIAQDGIVTLLTVTILNKPVA
ncbi:hypothetical protein ID866_3553 [Astraeus odoratus]|nr:hypothetical protein ID866_3553 [Astraeus odoratus]